LEKKTGYHRFYGLGSGGEFNVSLLMDGRAVVASVVVAASGPVTSEFARKPGEYEKVGRVIAVVVCGLFIGSFVGFLFHLFY